MNDLQELTQAIIQFREERPNLTAFLLTHEPVNVTLFSPIPAQDVLGFVHKYV